MPEAAVAAPTSPSPVAPVAAPTPAPAAPPSPAKPVSMGDRFLKHADIVDNKVATTPANPQRNAPKPEPKPEPTAAAPAPEPPKPAATAAAEPPQPATEPAKPGAPAALPDESAIGKMAPKALRDAYLRSQQENRKIAAELESAKTAKLNPPELERFTKTIEEQTQKIKDYEQKLQYQAFTESDEFAKSYKEPYTKAFASGRELAKRMTGQNEAGEKVQLTEGHFDRLMELQDPEARADFLEGLGLSSARQQMLIDASSQCRNILSKANEAEADFKKNGVELQRQQKEKADSLMKLAFQQSAESLKKHLEEPRKKMGEFFNPIDGDVKGNELLTKGFEWANEAFKTLAPPPHNLPPEAREKMVQAHAEFYNKAATWDRLAYLYGNSKKELNALREKLKAYEASEPAGGQPARPANGDGKESNDRPSRLFNRLNKYAT